MQALLLGTIALAALLRQCEAGWLGGAVKGGVKGKQAQAGGEGEGPGLVLPKLLPHEDSCYLLEFHSDNCDHCEQMEPVLKRLERDLGTVVRRINIFRRREFYGVLEAMGHDECGGLPFYYNRRTGQAICGATTYQNLRKWGTGSVKHMFQDAPESREADAETRPAMRKDVGAKQMLVDRMQKMARRGGKGGAAKAGAGGGAGAGAGAGTGGTGGKGKDQPQAAGKEGEAAREGSAGRGGAAAARVRERRRAREQQQQPVK